MKRIPSIGAITAAILLHIAPLEAQEVDSPRFVFDGFGTAGLVYSDEDRADFTSNVLVPDGAGFTRDVSAEVDSRLGLQLTGNLSPRLSSVAQVVVEQGHDDSYDPELEWVNVKYAPSQDAYVRVGRIVLPGVMASEYRKVGFALPWVRPPTEVYSLVPVTNSDGVDAGYSFRSGGFTNTIRINYGKLDIDLPDGTESQARDLWGLTTTSERDGLEFHLSYLRSRITVKSFDPLLNGFRSFGPAGAAIANRYEFDDEPVEFLGLGIRYDPGEWFVRAETAMLESDTIIGDRHGWYLTAGYRIRSFTPYITLARIDSDGNTSDPGLDTRGLPAPLAAQANGLNAALNDALSLAPAQKSIALGLRWDLARNLALKFQVDYLDLDRGSPGVLMNEQPGFRRGGSVTLLSAAIDFVF